MRIRRGTERGHADHGWLRSWHTFSFADYHDPAHMHFRALRVVNEDIVAPGTGFGMHGHRDMEILTWILSGTLRHEDSMGHRADITPGEVQVMSAGTGVMHSEVNPSATEPVHLLQIWMLPERRNLPPRYDQQRVESGAMQDRLALLAAPPGKGGIVEVFQDVMLYAAHLSPGREVALPLAAGRHAWAQVATGSLDCNGAALAQGDALGATNEPVLRFRAGPEGAHLLVFDLA